MARPLAEVGPAELWRGELWEELQQLQMMQTQIASVEEKLNAIGEADTRVQLLRTVPGVGSETGGSNCGTAGSAAALSESKSSKWLCRDGAESV
jgi:transposase